MEKSKTIYNGLEDVFVYKDNKKLRLGYTTGSCAAAASKAATFILLEQKEINVVDLLTPKGITLHLPVENIKIEQDFVSCAVRKDGGDDIDDTDGMLIYAKVKKIKEKEILIEGGKGIGRVTKKGLAQPIGTAAINPVPRKMIREAVREICDIHLYNEGIYVEIYAPEGIEIAKRTFNPRLGIEGGISILGTSGIVVPMSESALLDSIRTEMKMLIENENKYLIITPGNYGEIFLKEKGELELSKHMKCSNFVGETIDMALELGVKGILFVAHIGKFIKVSGGIMNTHSKCADSRAELMAIHALRAGASKEIALKVLDTITTEEALSILSEEGIIQKTMEYIMERIQFYLNKRAYNKIEIAAIVFSNAYGQIGETKNVTSWIKNYKRR